MELARLVCILIFDDMRVLRNICNEYLTYKGTLKKSVAITLADHKIFAMMLFKNLYPRDFAEIQSERGIIKEVFEGKPSYRKRKEEDIRAWLDEHRNYASEKDVLRKESELHELVHAPLHRIIDEHNISLVREKANGNGLLVFLVRRGYIDETYADYINYFKGVSYPTSDRNFIRAIKEQRETEFFYEIHKPFAVIRELSVADFGQKEVYNCDLVDALLSQAGEDEKKEALYTRLRVSDKKSWEFLCFYLARGKRSGMLVVALVNRWTNMWVQMEDQLWISRHQQDLFLARILENVPKSKIGELNIGGVLTDVFERNANILQRLKSVRPDDICAALDILSVQFYRLDIAGVPEAVLDDIFMQNRYALNICMVHNVIAYVASHLSKDFPAKSYTVIRAANYAPLMKRVHENLSSYVKDVMLQQQYLADDAVDVLALLGHLIEEVDLCQGLIEREAFCVSDLRGCCYAYLQNHEDGVHRIWDALLSKKKLEATWENVYVYWTQFQMTGKLWNFIEESGDLLRKSGTECLDDDFIRAFVNAGFDESILRILLPLVHEEHIDANTVNETLLEQVLLSSEASLALKEDLLQTYGAAYMTELIAKGLCSMQLPMTKEIFFAAWRPLDNSERVELMAECVDLLESEDFETCFSDMDEPHHDFTDRIKHKVRIPKTNANEKIARRLRAIEYITSFSDELIPSTNGNLIEERVLGCWVKAIS